MPATPADTTSTHTHCMCNICKHHTYHTTHQAQRRKQQTPSPDTGHHTTYTPCAHTHTAYTHHTQKLDTDTHTDPTAHTQRPRFSPQIHNVTHATCTTHQAPTCKHLPPPPACHTHSHTQLQHTHHKKYSYTSTRLSLLPQLLWELRELRQLRRSDSTSRACFYKCEVPRQLWPPP